MTAITTQDGTWIVRDLATGIVASGRTYPEAVAELRRLIASHTHARAARHTREGLAA
jgi:hypothetical protein